MSRGWGLEPDVSLPPSCSCCMPTCWSETSAEWRRSGCAVQCRSVERGESLSMWYTRHTNRYIIFYCVPLFFFFSIQKHSCILILIKLKHCFVSFVARKQKTKTLCDWWDFKMNLKAKLVLNPSANSELSIKPTHPWTWWINLSQITLWPCNKFTVLQLRAGIFPYVLQDSKGVKQRSYPTLKNSLHTGTFVLIIMGYTTLLLSFFCQSVCNFFPEFQS